MRNTPKFQNLKVIQKAGAAIMLLAGLMVLLKMIKLLPESLFTTNDVKNYIFLTGAFLYFLPCLTKFLKKGNTNARLMILPFLLGTQALIAQDYSKQMEGFQQSFSEKSVTPMEEHISTELKFDPIPLSNTPAILKNIVTNLPKLNSITILESSEGKAKVRYDFVGLGIRESQVYFDAEGKFIRIELIENLIKQEMAARKKMKESVQLPDPGLLGAKYPPQKVAFKAPDGLTVSGSLYHVGADKPVIVLCHQAGYNRLEYADIAPKLNEMGYNCLAVDLRSGGDFAGKPNVTAEQAKREGFQSQMVDARQDISAAVRFLANKYHQKVIVWGSSFSSSLAMLEGMANDKVKAVIAFSPGDYFGDTAPSLRAVFASADKPFLITSSKEEAEALATLMGQVSLIESQWQFVPESDGFHGSKALWTGQQGAEEYWVAIVNFLNGLKSHE